jgi:hypothetical protein
MIKFKKEYDHKNKHLTTACGIDEQLYSELIKKGVDVWANTETLSIAIETIEKQFKEYDQDLIYRFLITKFILFIEQKNVDMHMKQIAEGVISSLGINPEEFDISNTFEEKKCENCNEKDSCKDSSTKKIDENLKH